MKDLEYIRSYCEEYSYPQEAMDSILSAYQLIAADAKYKEAFDQAEILLFAAEEVEPQDLYAGLQDIAGAIGVNAYIVPLVFYIRETRRLKELYDQKEIAENVQRGAMEDLLTKAKECKLVKGCYGLLNPSFVHKYFRLRLFALGRMQFELGEFARESCELGGKVIKKGDLVIRCHIPGSGKPFDDETRMDSYGQAYAFFKDAFEDKPVIFTCDSWLLFVLNEKILPERSNIVRFMHDFKILGLSYYDESGSQLWRIFGKAYTGDPEDMPADTALRTGYQRWLRDGNYAGSSYGVFLFDGENIVKD